MTLDTTQKNIFFYRILANAECRQINSFATTKLQIRYVVGTKFGIGISLTDDPQPIPMPTSKYVDDVVFVPLNGGAPLILNPDGREFQGVEKMLVSPDQTKMYVAGFPAGYAGTGRSGFFSFDLTWRPTDGK